MAGPPPALAAARRAVRTALAGVPAGKRVLVACSGGADSLALAVAARDAAVRAGWQVGAVVVDHRLQEGSAGVAQRAARTCRDLGLAPVVIKRVQVGSLGGPEAAARTARYGALTAAATENAAVAVLLGHTLDDQAETVLLGLARGSGARSLAGMREHDGLWRRPFLGLRRTATEAVCEGAGLQPWKDPTNAGGPADPVRSQLRARVFPVLAEVLGPGAPEALARTAAMAREDDDHLAAAAAVVLQQARDHSAMQSEEHDAAGSIVGRWDVRTLALAPAAVRRRCVHALLRASGAPAGALSRAHVLAVDALLVDWRGQGPVALPGRRSALRRYGTLVVVRPA